MRAFFFQASAINELFPCVCFFLLHPFFSHGAIVCHSKGEGGKGTDAA
jgi:hypothetical protein